MHLQYGKYSNLFRKHLNTRIFNYSLVVLKYLIQLSRAVLVEVFSARVLHAGVSKMI